MTLDESKTRDLSLDIPNCEEAIESETSFLTVLDDQISETDKEFEAMRNYGLPTSFACKDSNERTQPKRQMNFQEHYDMIWTDSGV